MYCTYASVANIKKFEYGNGQTPTALIPCLTSECVGWEEGELGYKRTSQSVRGTRYKATDWFMSSKGEVSVTIPFLTHIHAKKHKDYCQSFCCFLAKLDSWGAWRFNFNGGRPTGEVPISNRHRNWVTSNSGGQRLCTLLQGSARVSPLLQSRVHCTSHDGWRRPHEITASGQWISRVNRGVGLVHWTVEEIPTSMHGCVLKLGMGIRQDVKLPFVSLCGCDVDWRCTADVVL